MQPLKALAHFMKYQKKIAEYLKFLMLVVTQAIVCSERQPYFNRYKPVTSKVFDSFTWKNFENIRINLDKMV